MDKMKAREQAVAEKFGQRKHAIRLRMTKIEQKHIRRDARNEGLQIRAYMRRELVSRILPAEASPDPAPIGGRPYQAKLTLTYGEYRELKAKAKDVGMTPNEYVITMLIKGEYHE